MPAAVATLLAAVVLLVTLAYLPRGGVDTGLPAVETEAKPGPPRLPTITRVDRTEPATGTTETAGEEYAAPPCDGCLNERGALDVAETFIFHMRHEKYIGSRAELYSDIAAMLEAAGFPPPHETGLPKLPPGLVDAPPERSMSGRVLPFVERPEETWVIWVQEGWFDTQSYIDGGILPPTAAAWPPLKHERYMLVDARTGEVFADDIWRGRHRRSLGAFGDVAAQAAAKRAEHWIAKRLDP